MVLIELKNKERLVVQAWDEMRRWQLLEVVDTIFLKKYDPAQMVLKLLKSLAGLSWWQFLRLKAEDLEEFLYLSMFVFQEKISFTKQLIPVYKKFYGPGDEAGNITGEELVFCEYYHELWWKNKDDVQALNNFISIIYRPKKKGYDENLNADGDARIPFNKYLCEWNASRKIKRWPRKVKFAIGLWYAGCRQAMVDNNPEVFGGDGEPPKYGLISILRAIAEKGTYGTFEKVEKMSAEMIMIELNERIAEAKRMEEEAKKIKNG